MRERRRAWIGIGTLMAVLCGAACASRSRGITPDPVPSTATSHSTPVLEPQGSEAGAAAEPGVRHVVLTGQTLWRIARAYGIPLDELARVNGISNPAVVVAGRVLFVPGARSVLEVPPSVPGAQAESPSAAPALAWRWPVQGGEVVSRYGAVRRHGAHGGIDIRAAHGQEVLAIASGRVTYSGAGLSGYGKTVIVDHGHGLTSLYAHNSQLLVQEGDLVDVGQPIARAGRTGNATTDHCHLEVRRQNVAIDPMSLLATAVGALR